MAGRLVEESSARLSGRPPIEHGESIYLDRAIGRPGTSLEVPFRESTIEMESSVVSCENPAKVGSNEGGGINAQLVNATLGSPWIASHPYP
jgi:hypothetical protein